MSKPEIFDWANMPPIEPLSEPPVEITKPRKAETLALAFSLALLAIGTCDFIYNTVNKSSACPDLPDPNKVSGTVRSMANAPTGAEDFWRAAKAKGLRFVPEIQKKKIIETIEESPTADSTTHLVNNYTSYNFGFNTSLDKKTKIPKNKLYEYKSDLQEFVSNTSSLPVQLVRDSISSLSISDHMNDKAVGTFDAYSEEISSKPYNLSYVFNHEWGHALDHKVCGSAFADDDPGYTKQNPPSFKYKANYDVEMASSVAANKYGESDVQEDKATLFEKFLAYSAVEVPGSPTNFSLNKLLFGPLTERGSILLAKLSIFLNRIDNLVPGSASYLSSLSKWRHGEPGPDQDPSQKTEQVDVFIKY